MSIITLTTDFGTGSPYTAAMKGVILGLNPAVTLVDISHEVPAQDVRRAALLLEDVAERFPAGTIHVVVVDPGVGTDRALVYARIGRQQYVAPDNGVLSRVACRRPELVIRLENPEYRLQPVAPTFHGRDILAPAAAHVSLGLDPTRLGPPHETLAALDWPELQATDQAIEGSILWVDGFGNLITDLTAEHLAGRWPHGCETVVCRGAETRDLVQTYGQRAPGTLVALIGSTGRLELAVVQGSAAQRLGAGAGDRVTLRWKSARP